MAGGSLADEVAVLMCEAEAAIGARSDVLPEVKAAPGVSAVFWLLFVSRRAARCRAGYCAHVYAHRLSRIDGTSTYLTGRSWPGSWRPLVRLIPKRRERMLHARANVHAAPELVA
jgi:hypothetical protein